jgi:hypothetical protein
MIHSVNRQTYRVNFVTHTAVSALIEACSEEEALEMLKRNDCDYSDPMPLESEVISIEVLYG